MGWIIIALATHLCWATVNVGDKYIVSNRIKTPYIYLIWITLIGGVSILLIPFVNFSLPTINQTIYLLLAAALYFFGGFPYIKAMQQEDVTRINVLWTLIPMFTLGLSWFTLGETLTQTQLKAFGILLIGAILASIHIKKRSIKLSKASGLAIIACLAYAGYTTAMKYITNDFSFLNAFIWTHIFMFGFAIITLSIKKVRNTAKTEFNKVDRKLGAAILSMGVLDHTGILLNTLALSLAPAALVLAMEGFQSVFVFLIVISLSILTKINLKEEMDTKNIILKVIAIAIGVLGIITLYHQ
jgi:drug/metabolite transporter (DMT)-like permease